MDFVIESVNSERIKIIVLTVPFEENIDWASQCKSEKYEDLWGQCIQNGRTSNIFPVEVEYQGFITKSTSPYMTKLSFSPIGKYKYTKKLQEQLKDASVWFLVCLFGWLGFMARVGVVVCNLVISVDMHPYFTGIAPNIISSTNTTQNFTIT